MTATGERWARRLRWTGALSLGFVAQVWLVYAVIANLFIGSGMLENLASGDGEQVLLQYESAWTWLPGRVHVKGLSLRVQDSNIQFHLGIDRASLRIDLISLTRRTFSASRIEADGVIFHFRHKMLPMGVNEQRAAAYPPIPGFADPPLKASYVDAPLTDANYNLWTVELNDVHASARDLWFMEWRFLGDATVTGAFRLKPVRELRIDPTVLSLRNGALSVGAKTVLGSVNGTLETHVGTFDVRSRVGLDVLQQIDARIDATGKVATIAPMAAMYVKEPTLQVAAGAGDVSLHVAVKAGRLTTDSVLEYRSADVTLQIPQGLVHSDLCAVVRVLSDRLVVGLFVAAADLTLNDRERLTMRAFAAGADVNGTALWRPFQVKGGSFSVEKFAVADLASLQALLPQGVVLHGGSANGSAHADVAVAGSPKPPQSGESRRHRHFAASAARRLTGSLPSNRSQSAGCGLCG